ncbi:DUF2937 family protein [Prosthecomicrobium pneumaticum]|uniref:DUF2937 domain-containing protein n=1 Tax=Prosthecomicrobium pneumaticum TaxID=81895 RepID=A0A7W9CW73_9HYPH|nr:DUF2937 family protein [Prosthecomicrobium pneumaticum]MBB5752477.1 hypothetical protein [Prosthecomicrobium pneumaticum]
MARPVLLALSLFAGFVAAQGPEFGQQYRQRLGGAAAELGRVVADFDRDAAEAGLDRARAVESMRRASDEFIRLRAASMERAFERYAALSRQQAAFETGAILATLRAVAAAPDPTLMSGTWRDYEPAVPTTPDGFVAAGLGFGLVYVLARTLGMTLRRPKRRRRRPDEDDDFAAAPPPRRPHRVDWGRSADPGF